MKSLKAEEKDKKAQEAAAGEDKRPTTAEDERASGGDGSSWASRKVYPCAGTVAAPPPAN